MRHRRQTWFRQHLPMLALVGITALLMLGSFLDWVLH